MNYIIDTREVKIGNGIFILEIRALTQKYFLLLPKLGEVILKLISSEKYYNFFIKHFCLIRQHQHF